MTEQEFFDKADKELEELNQHRANFMADKTPVEVGDIPKLLEIGNMLRNEDTNINAYGLYKHPEARAKLFSQIAEACFMMVVATTPTPVEPTQAQRLNFCEYLEGQFQKIIKKRISSTDKQALGELLDLLELPAETENQFIRDMAVSGLLAKEK